MLGFNQKVISLFTNNLISRLAMIYERKYLVLKANEAVWCNILELFTHWFEKLIFLYQRIKF